MTELPNTLAELAPLVGYRAEDFDVDPSDLSGRAGASAWERLYKTERAYLSYPYDVAVRLVRKHISGTAGVVLDHGCGAGNHLEFMTRMGLRTIGSEISWSALGRVRGRFRGAMLACPPLHLFDPARPLALPPYDHVFAWLSICYNPRDKVIADIATLIAGLPKGGAFILAVPSRDDVSYRDSVQRGDGAREIVTDISGQRGMVLTIPAGADELAGWCAGIDIREIGEFGWTIGGVRSAFLTVYGVKS